MKQILQHTISINLMNSERCFYIYCYHNKLTNERYFGKGKGNRWREHVRVAQRGTKSSSLLVKALRSLGVDSFNIDILIQNLSNDEALCHEKRLILEYRTNVLREYEPGIHGHGYNRSDGGERCVEPWNRGLKTGPRDSQTKQKLSKSLQGHTPSNKGTKHTEESLVKMRKPRSVPMPTKGRYGPGTLYALRHLPTIRMIRALGLNVYDTAQMFSIGKTTLDRITGGTYCDRERTISS